MPSRMHEHEVPVDAGLVERLLGSQFPDRAHEPLTPVEPWGTDNAIWRLGDEHVVRLPRIETAVEQVGFEATWLPRIGPHLPVRVPEPVATGRPGDGYPFPWAIHRWLPGTLAGPDTIGDPEAFAEDLASVVRALHAIPVAGARTARNRARPLADYDVATRRAIDAAAHLIDARTAIAIWEEALAAPVHAGPPVWVHGDLEGNALVTDGRLSGLVDWGSACVGDPAVDVQVIWSPLCTDESRTTFLRALSDIAKIDDATVVRSRGAAINQACAALPYYLDTYPLIVERSWHKLEALGVDTRRA